MKKMRLKSEKGISTPAAIGIVALVMLIMGASLTLVMGERMMVYRQSTTDKAVNVSEAGVNDYIWRLNKDNDYYLNYVHPAEGQDNWLAWGPGEYHLNITPPAGNVPMVTVESTGRVKGPTGAYVTRTITAKIRKRQFTNYIYITDNEMIEGTTTKIWWITGDVVDGPLHTNDNLHTDGQPHFMRAVTMSGTLDSRNGTPVFDQGYKEHADPVDFPATNLQLKTFAEQNGYYYYGETTITLNGTSLNIVNNDTSGRTTGPKGNVSMPANGVIYVDGNAGAKWSANNGDCYVSGNISGLLTIAARNIVYVTGDLRYNSPDNDMLGLVGENYVFVNHYSRTGVDVAPFDIRIDAAIVAVNHSFGFERYDEGSQKGTLTVFGSIAQKYRGPVGTFGAHSTGYHKNYSFDARMEYNCPPHFLEPVNAGFEVISWQETRK
jgi:hypothetical protein